MAVAKVRAVRHLQPLTPLQSERVDPPPGDVRSEGDREEDPPHT